MTSSIDPKETREDIDLLMDQAMTPGALKTAAVALAAAGFLVLVVGLQTVLISGAHTVLEISAYCMLVAGVAAIAVASKLARAREWTLLPSIVLAAAMVVGSGVFFIWSFTHGIFSLLALLAVGGAAATAVLVALAIAPFRRLLVVRGRLRDLGVDLDFDF